MGSRNFVCLVLVCGALLSLWSLFRSSNPSSPALHEDTTDARPPYKHETVPHHPHAPVPVPPTPPKEDPPPPTNPAPALTLIVLWSPHKRNEDYLPSFFASVGANPAIDLLLIKFDKYGYDDGQCERLHAQGVRNVREVCLDVEEFVGLHVDYFCGVWGCDHKQREVVERVLEERVPLDRVNSMYRPFRAEIFKQFLHPDLKLWGWCDLDQIFGSFARMFPWDLAPSYDVLFASWPVHGYTSQHLFVPGHFAVFRRAPDVAAAFLQVHFLKSYEAFVRLPEGMPSEAVEEAEFSHVLLMRTPLTFVRFPAMAESMYHLDSLNGVFAIENAADAPNLPIVNNPDSSIGDAIASARHQILPLLVQRKSEPARPTFSAQGVESNVELLSGAKLPKDLDLWFPRGFGVAYHSSLSASQSDMGRNARRYVLRRARGGAVSERFEPERPISLVHPESNSNSNSNDEDGMEAAMHRGEHVKGTWLREGLYVHLQHEKYRKWWDVPDHALGEGEVMFVDRAHGARLWDGAGREVWRSWREEGEDW
ncbi:unnamed protein product [Peniophora sp. CBMAI 1063]|nr:unnamed protein product [Peniophora sp. CBMAI 1063]